MTQVSDLGLPGWLCLDNSLCHDIIPENIFAPEFFFKVLVSKRWGMWLKRGLRVSLGVPNYSPDRGLHPPLKVCTRAPTVNTNSPSCCTSTWSHTVKSQPSSSSWGVEVQDLPSWVCRVSPGCAPRLLSGVCSFFLWADDAVRLPCLLGPLWRMPGLPYTGHHCLCTHATSPGVFNMASQTRSRESSRDSPKSSPR
jgi:hypothetical protein